jgi:hypothetical protein
MKIDEGMNVRQAEKDGAQRVDCYFATGTGRCGTMLLSQVLSTAGNTHCNHEHSVPTLVMKDAYYRGDYTDLNAASLRAIDELVVDYAKMGKSYGECSSHLFLVLPELYKRYGPSVRFALVVRRPDTFIGSALARGFFDPHHPKPCEHVRPSPKTEVGGQWETLTPFEKGLWYWNMVNSTVLDVFRRLPAECTRVVRMEDINLPEVERLFQFFGLAGFSSLQPDIRNMLDVRVNASPGQGDDRSLNPWSQEIALGDISGWSPAQRESLLRWAGPAARTLYPEWMNENF